nr:MAG TPA: hypothetical protein [Caudoviricetes sp.]
MEDLLLNRKSLVEKLTGIKSSRTLIIRSSIGVWILKTCLLYRTLL